MEVTEAYNKSFKYWKTQEVEDVFGIAPTENKTRLNNWLTAKCEVTEEEKKRLLELQEHLLSKVEFWNEAAIKFFFIGPMISMLHYDNIQYNAFLEQNLSIQINDQITISGNVDFMLATGKQIPKIPFFALHEYKPEPAASNDPQGQLLVAMLAAQRQNKAKNVHLPLYGVYVIGRLWFFLILEGDSYCKSLAYDATQSDLFDIYCILKKVKDYVEEELKIVA
ncbi:MAG: hypothetical protein R3E32_09605 [Chitinophagales bacterium]